MTLEQLDAQRRLQPRVGDAGENGAAGVSIPPDGVQFSRTENT